MAVLHNQHRQVEHNQHRQVEHSRIQVEQHSLARKLASTRLVRLIATQQQVIQQLIQQLVEQRGQL